MELNETSAQRINDVYSELAAITAADTHEIGVAMSKTASIANNANMEFETTAALLSQIIETTREAPETAGTAMKTIIARFSEVKELFSQGQLIGTDSEGEEININKIDTALQQVGISLKDFLIGNQGLDDVFLQLAERWNTLDLATQRYIATVAAGSRQQSRFLAMMSNYDRTMELVDAAYNSTGASSAQFEKTMDSLEAKLNELENAWNEFTMGLANSKVIKGAVDALTWILNLVNDITGAFGDGVGAIAKFATALGLLNVGKVIFDKLLTSITRVVQAAKGAEQATETLTSASSGSGTSFIGKGIFTGIKKLIGERKNIANLLFRSSSKGGAAAATTLQSSITGTGLLSKGLKGIIGLLGKVPGPLMAISTAVTAGIAIFNHFHETAEERLERLQDEAAAAEDAYKNTTTAVNELSNSINSIKDSDSLFEGLTEGTIEWKQALIEANQYIIDLIDKFPQLAQHVDSINGRLTIPEEELDKVLEQQIEKQQTMAAASQFAKAAVVDEEYKQLLDDAEDIEDNIERLKTEQKNISNNTNYSHRSQGLSSSGGNTDADYDNLVQDNETSLLEANNKIEAKSIELQSTLEMAYSTMISDVEGLSSNTTNAISSILATLYDYETFEDLVDKYKDDIDESDAELDELFEEVTGAAPDEGLSDDDKKDQIARAKATEELAGSADKLAEIISESNADERLADLLLRGATENSNIQGSTISDLLTPEEQGGLGYTIESIKNIDPTQLGINLDALATELGITKDELINNFRTNLVNATWAFELVTDSANLTKEELDNLAIQLQKQKGIIDAGGQADLSGLTYQQMEALDFSGLTGEERTNMEQAVINAQEQKRQAVSSQNNLYNEAVSDQNSLNSAMQNADLTAEELSRVKGELIGLNPALKENEELLNEVSTMYLNMDTGLRKVAEAWQANADALDNPDDVVEYSKAIGELQASIGTLLGTDVSYEFVEDNLDLIKEALDGNVDSLIELQRLSTLEFIGTLDLPTEDMKTLEDYAMKYNGFEMEMGAELDDTGFINTLNNMMAEGLMTADQVQQYLNSIGYEADIVKQTQTLKQKTEFQGDGLLSWVKGSFTTSQEVPVITSIHALGDTAPRQAARASSSRGGSSGSTGSSGGGSTKQEDPWENTFDRLYNLLEDINEEERIRNELELEFNRITEDGVYNSNQLLENLRQQEASLRRQQKMEQMLYNERKKEMRNLIAGNTDLQKYGTYNWADQTIEINWDLIESVTNNDTGERIEEYISELERIQESMDEAKDSLEDISDQIDELKDFGKDEFEEFEQMTLDAIVFREESRINELETISNSIDDSNNKLINSLRDSIDDIRQARQNEETEEQISDTQNYLAYLQRDASNANRLEILQTQDSLEQQEQDYTDTLIDQKINELEEQNNLAMEQRQLQIEIARAQLQHQQDAGLLWTEVSELWKHGINNKGVILPNSELYDLLKKSEDYQSFSKFGKTEWANKVSKIVEAADTWRKNKSGKGLNGVEAKLTTINTSIGKIKVGTSTTANSKVTSSSKGGSSSGSSGGGGSSSSSSSGSASKTNIKKLQEMLNNILGTKLTVDGVYGTGTRNAVKQLQKKVGVSADGLYGTSTKNAVVKYINRTAGMHAGTWFSRYLANAVYKKGGLADFTGPAWLDGTKSKPELVLNAQDTQNFIQLKDILSEVMNGTLDSSSDKGGDNYYDITIQVDELSNDYDVDQLAARVKKIINDDGRYRNVNNIQLMR